MIKKIFFPECCIRSGDGIIVGVVDATINVAYVIAVVHFPVTPRQLNQYLSKYGSDDVELVPLGMWFSADATEERFDSDFHQVVPRLFGLEKWLCMKPDKSEDGDFSIDVKDFERSRDEADFLGTKLEKKASDSIVIVYNQKEIWDSNHLTELTPDSERSPGTVENLFTIVSACRKGILSFEAGLNSESDDIKITHCCIEREMSLVYFMLLMFTKAFLEIVHFFLFYIDKFYSQFLRVFSPVFRMLFSILKVLSFCSHTSKKFSDFHHSMLKLREDERTNSKLKKEEVYKSKNVISSFFMDSLLGVLFLLSLHYFGLLSRKTTKELFLPSVELIAGQVEELIKWLMGIPAGLKLNHPLNQFLGHFFLYHVRLWLEYARLMMNLIPHLMTYCLLSSCLGFSFFLSVISDMVSTLSFHVYCFYVYAGRLYGLQIKGLISLWRLFRGKKWNPLRQRVDSLEESGQGADQLFVGTLLFTVLLFLLPTTSLYYAIFALLRVAVLAIQVFLSGLVFIFSDYPWYSTGLRFFQPHKFVKSVQCHWMSAGNDDFVPNEAERTVYHKDDQSVVLRMMIQPQSYWEIIYQGLCKRREESVVSTNPKSLMKKLIFGDLIRWS